MEINYRLIIFIIAFYIFISCGYNSSKTGLSIGEFTDLVKKETGVDIGSSYIIILDSLKPSETSFDNDYIFYIKAKYVGKDFGVITKKIRDSHFFEDYLFKDKKNKQKGVWIHSGKGYKFLQNPKFKYRDMIYMEIDTVNKTINIEIIHI